MEGSTDRLTAAPGPAIMVLQLLKERMPVPMSSYGMGLYIQDPTRPLSMIIKTLSKDGYIRKAADRGRRTVFWAITDVGLKSLERRAALAAAASRALRDNPSFTIDEELCLLALRQQRRTTSTDLAAATGLRVMATRLALKALDARGLGTFDDGEDRFAIGPHGDRAAERLREIGGSPGLLRP